MEEISKKEKILLDDMVWLRICFTNPILEMDGGVLKTNFNWTSNTAKELYEKCEKQLLEIRREVLSEENIKHRRGL